MTVLTVQEQTGNLPAEVTRFIGRRTELTQVRDRLRRSRLVTLTGVGGVGKTRLALRVAAETRADFPDGAWLVELSPLREPEQLARAVAEALRLPDLLAGDPLDLLTEHLSRRQALLVLDTCEHLVDACAMLAEVLLRAAPNLSVLATSREPLDVLGEHCVVIQPLEAHAGAVDLFSDRAEAMVPGFTLTDANRSVVTRLCVRLDGIPLAIELAAVRLRAMSVDQLEARIDDRFQILGVARGSHDRHQTLRAAISWSHELCTEEERLLWARLAVFPGDFDLAAVEVICPDELLPVAALFDVLSRLVEKSVLLHLADTGRFRMLDTIREYGLERLTELGTGPLLARRHRDHFLDLAEQASAAALTDRQSEWLATLAGEHANLRVALDHCFHTPGEEPTGVAMTVALHDYWLPRGMFNEGRAWIRRALEVEVADPALRGRTLVGAGTLAVAQGDLAAAAPLLAEAGRIAVSTGDRRLTALIACVEGRALTYEGRLTEARERHLAAQRILDEVGYASPLALLNLPLVASTLIFEGDHAGSLPWAERGIAAAAGTGEQWAYSMALYIRGAARFLMGELPPATEDVRAALRIKDGLGDLFGLACCLDLCAGCAFGYGEIQRAATLYGVTTALWQTIGLPLQLGPQYLEIREAVVQTGGQFMPRERIEEIAAASARLPLAQAIELAMGVGTGDVASAAADGTPQGPARPAELTRRERQIAELVAEGLSNREIAERLVIAKRTADSHVEHILAKLAVGSRAQIADWVRNPSAAERA